MVNKIEWGNGHKLYITDYKKARLAAYYKSFYFTTYLNGKEVKRI
jgi:hypothetical protein